MDVILHIGAHRTASASFQHYLQANAHRLTQDGIGYWGPVRAQAADARAEGAHPDAQFAAARDRIRENLDRAEARGIRQLIVSDQTVVGPSVKCLDQKRLYSGIGERMARYAEVFGKRLRCVNLMIRSQDTFWGSVIAEAVAAGRALPAPEELAALMASPRAWRDVITDLACAVAGAGIEVQTFEAVGGLPERRLAQMTGQQNLPGQRAREWLGRAPDCNELRTVLKRQGASLDFIPAGQGRWNPFDRDQSMRLREAYADDLYWLRAGADGLATLKEETGPAKEGKTPVAGDVQRGQSDGKDDRRLA